jgi:hypothetical protein
MTESSSERYNYMFGGNDKSIGTKEHAAYKGSYADRCYFPEARKVIPNQLGRIKRSVWTINPQPFSEAHFAVYPEKLCETPIKAGCPEFVCRKCGKARYAVYEEKRINTRPGLDVGNGKSGKEQDPNSSLHTSDLSKYRQEIIRYNPKLSDCGCNAGFDSGIVLDPFCGSGTTGLVALKLARRFIGIELNPEYIKIAQKRLEPYLLQTRLL